MSFFWRPEHYHDVMTTKWSTNIGSLYTHPSSLGLQVIAVASYESLKNLWISRDISFTLLSVTVPQVLEQSIFQSLDIRNVKVFREPVVVRKELSIGVLNLIQKTSFLLVLLISLISTAIVKY